MLILILCSIIFIIVCLAISKKLKKLSHSLSEIALQQEYYDNQLLNAVKGINDAVTPEQKDNVQDLIHELKKLEEAQKDKKLVQELLNNYDDN